MRLVVRESQYKNLLVEDLGVSRAVIAYTNLVLNKLEPIIKRGIDNNKNLGKFITIGFKDIKNIYLDSMDDFIDLPIELIQISFSFITLKKDTDKKKFYTAGAAYQIDKKDEEVSKLQKISLSFPKRILEEVEYSIVAKLDLQVTINSTFQMTDYSELLYDFRDTLMHEFNHILEFYNRKKPINVSLSFAGEKNKNIPQKIFEVWQEFLDYIYYSEPYEMNAMAQEAYSKVLRMDFENFKKTDYWKNSEKMKNFDAETMYQKVVSKIDEIRPEAREVFLRSMFKWFKEDYLKSSVGQKLTPIKLVTSAQDMLSLMVKFEKRIQMSGEKMQRRYMRLYSLASDLETK